MKVKLLFIQPGGDSKSSIVEHAARLCYCSDKSSSMQERRDFLFKLANLKHLSVFEHARYVKLFCGNPYELYWGVRHGVNITKRPTGVFVVSLNARNEMELTGNNIVCDSGDDPLLRYDDLSTDEKLHHASATFEVSDVARNTTHQLVRHRISSQDPCNETMTDFDLDLSVSQESMRYVDMSDKAEYTCPLSIASSGKLHRIFSEHMKSAWEIYGLYRAAGIPKEDARYVLPIATASRLVLTMNFSAWLHFCRVRCSKKAQWEIRGVATEILRLLYEQAPTVFGELWSEVSNE